MPGTKMKTLIAALLLFTSIVSAETFTYVGDSNISGSRAGALSAWKAEFAGFKIRRETFESINLEDLRIPLDCFSSSCYPQAIEGFTKGGLVWSSPGKAMRLISNTHQGQYAMRVFDQQHANYTVRVKSLKQLAYGICFDLDTNGGNNDIRISLDGTQVASFKLNAYGGKFVYPVHRWCVIDTNGFREVALTRQDIDVGQPGIDEWHPSMFSTDNVYFMRSSTVPAFGELSSYPPPVLGENGCPEGQEPIEEDDGIVCEDIE